MELILLFKHKFSKDSIITNNSIGIINEGAGTVTATYNNVWNNSNTNYKE